MRNCLLLISRCMQAADVQAELQQYLNSKNINSLFIQIVESLLIEKPSNPIAFIIEYLFKQYPDQAKLAREFVGSQPQLADNIGPSHAAPRFVFLMNRSLTVSPFTLHFVVPLVQKLQNQSETLLPIKMMKMTTRMIMMTMKMKIILRKIRVEE